MRVCTSIMTIPRMQPCSPRGHDSGKRPLSDIHRLRTRVEYLNTYATHLSQVLEEGAANLGNGEEAGPNNSCLQNTPEQMSNVLSSRQCNHTSKPARSRERVLSKSPQPRGFGISHRSTTSHRAPPMNRRMSWRTKKGRPLCRVLVPHPGGLETVPFATSSLLPLSFLSPPLSPLGPLKSPSSFCGPGTLL